MKSLNRAFKLLGIKMGLSSSNSFDVKDFTSHESTLQQSILTWYEHLHFGWTITIMPVFVNSLTKSLDHFTNIRPFIPRPPCQGQPKKYFLIHLTTLEVLLGQTTLTSGKRRNSPGKHERLENCIRNQRQMAESCRFYHNCGCQKVNALERLSFIFPSTQSLLMKTCTKKGHFSAAPSLQPCCVTLQ